MNCRGKRMVQKQRIAYGVNDCDQFLSFCTEDYKKEETRFLGIPTSVMIVMIITEGTGRIHTPRMVKFVHICMLGN